MTHYPEGTAEDKVFEFDKPSRIPVVEQRYRWQFSQPDDRLRVRMRSFESGREMFSAALDLRAVSACQTLRQALLRFPLMTVRVITAIYFRPCVLESAVPLCRTRMPHRRALIFLCQLKRHQAQRKIRTQQIVKTQKTEEQQHYIAIKRSRNRTMEEEKRLNENAAVSPVFDRVTAKLV